MLNEQSLSNAFKVVSFEGGFHGRSLGALSLTRTKPIHKLDIPAFHWPAIPFPALAFPLAANEAANRAAEARSLDALEAAFREHPNEIAAVIVEPIQGEGGDRHASASFFRELRTRTAAHGAALILDEVQTGGGASGTMWAHDAFDLPSPPDIVTFSKKMQLGGYYTTDEFVPDEPLRIFNTFLGDPLRAAQLEVIVEVIERDHLLENVRVVGPWLVRALEDLGARHPKIVSGARGLGTFAAIDTPDTAMQTRLLSELRARGLEVGGSGPRTIRLRPALVLRPKHAAEAMSIFEDAVKAIEARP
jgi:4-aminobutyrate aminotransferase/(S)-3-amino-2-methylpropionate transaminase